MTMDRNTNPTQDDDGAAGPGACVGMATGRPSWPAFALLLVALTLLSPYFVISHYDRPSADDYGAAAAVKASGWWASQATFYTTCNGRYTASALITLLVTLGPEHYGMVAAMLIAAFILASYALIRAIAKHAIDKVECLVLACLLTFCYLTSMPSLCQGFYWLSGAVTYQAGNILSILLLSFILGASRGIGRTRMLSIAALCSATALLAAGCNETMMLLLLTVLVVGAVDSLLRRDPRFRLWACSLAGCLAGAAIVAMAPGNARRIAHFPGGRMLWPAVRDSVGSAFYYAGEWVQAPSLALVVMVVAYFLWRRSAVQAETPTRRLLGIAFAGLLCFVISFFPAFWSMGQHPPDRTLDVIYLVFIACIAAAMLVAVRCLGDYWRAPPSCRRAAAVVLVLATAGLVFLSVRQDHRSNFRQVLLDLGGTAQEYRRQFDERDRMVAQAAAAGRKTMDVPPLTACPRTLWFLDLTPDANDWVNHGYAEFWGLKSVRTRPAK